jgi:hypothetical protein
MPLFGNVIEFIASKLMKKKTYSFGNFFFSHELIVYFYAYSLSYFSQFYPWWSSYLKKVKILIKHFFMSFRIYKFVQLHILPNTTNSIN